MHKLHEHARGGMLAVALLLAASGSQAQQPALTPPEGYTAISDADFQGLIDKTLNATTQRGTKVALRLEKDGRSVISQGFNDVGRWRPDGPGAYCVRWNKLPMEDRCAMVVRRDGKLAILQPNNQLSGIDSIE